jgi:3-oxoacyl-[acyl-carrier protein] reductase
LSGEKALLLRASTPAPTIGMATASPLTTRNCESKAPSLAVGGFRRHASFFADDHNPAGTLSRVRLDLDGRTAIVCGASAGIGLGIAEALADEGANVAMLARRRDALEREAERLGALAVRGDVTVPGDLERLVSRTVEAFGGIDIVVNNSGGPPRTAALEMDEENIEAAVQLMLVSAVRLTSLCLPYLERSGHGRIVTVTSSTVREPVDNLALSNSVRPGVVGWSKTLAREIGAKGITVNCIAPGRIDTERLREVYPDGPTESDLAAIPLRRLGTAREVGDLVAFLCSDRGGYISGGVIPVDGGLVRSLL